MEAIAAIGAAATPTTAVQATGFLPASGEFGLANVGASVAPASFGSLVVDGLQNVNTQLMANQTDLQKLATGEAQNLHQIMIRLEESRISFQLMVQVRNRLLEAYQDVMKMPI